MASKGESIKDTLPGWQGDTIGRPQRPDESFGEFLDGKAERNGDRVYMYFEDRAVSYQQLRDRVGRIANGLLALGVKNQEKVAIMMSNNPEYVYCWYALDAIGAVFVPVNIALKGVGLAYIVNQSDSETIILEQQLLDNLKSIEKDLTNIKRIIVLPAGEEKVGLPAGCISLEDLYHSSSKVPYSGRQPGDMIRIQYTSGTTGLPKGCVRRHPPAAAAPVDSAAEPYLHSAKDIPYVALPLFHLLAQMNCTATLNLESTLALAQRFSARRFWPEVRKFGCTRFTFAGSIGHILLKQPPQPDDRDQPLRIGEGWTTLRDIKEEFEKRFDVILYERYATSDGGGSTINLPGGKKGSIGKGDGLARITRIVDENGNECPPNVIGEIVSKPRDEKTPATVEYYKMADKSQEKTRDGWFHTGDYGYRDEEGWLFFSDRERQFIRRGGENISSYEIERIVNQHPSVLESAATGVRSEVGEQEVKISLVLQPGKSLQPEDLLAYCEERMAYYMVPRYVDFRDSLPTTETHRVQKYKLVDEGVTSEMWDMVKAGYELKR